MIRWTAVALYITACAQTVTTVPITTDERSVMVVVRQALENDAAGLPAESLYSRNATVVTNGAEYTDGKRFAGMGGGGVVRISSMSGDVNRGFAWAYVSYRWMSPDGAMAQSARASFVLELQDGAWRIRHAHSSLILPWQRG